MKLDQSGKLLLGTTNIAPGSGDVAGSVISPDGYISVSRTSVSAEFNRIGTNGDIIVFRKGGTLVGSWQARGDVVSTIILDPRTNGAGLTATANTIYPTSNTGAIGNTTALVDLGTNGYEFRNLSLSGASYIPDVRSTGIQYLTHTTDVRFRNSTGSERMRIDASGYIQMGAPISTHIGTSQLFVNRGVNAAAATSGTTQTGGALRLRGGDNAVLDMGMNSVNTWIQATDRANLANGYPLSLNPNGGNVGIGTASPAQKLHVEGTGHMFTLENTSTGTDQYAQQLLKSGTALNYFWGANQNSTAWGGANSLNMQSNSGAIAFFTSGSTLRMRIHETSGNIDIPNGDMTFASGHGIDFSATANSATTGTTHTSSLLDDYEEGYWTPIFTGSSGGTFTMSLGLGSYTKIGNLIHLTWYAGTSGLGTATGMIRIGNLPYAALSGGTSNSRIVTGSCMVDNLTLNSGRTMVVPYMSHAGSDIKFYQSGTSVGWLETPVDAVFSMIGGISYRTV
jgi:hypothetical protein